MANKYKYILFDWDGCLAKTLDVWMNAYETVFPKYGVKATKREIAYHFGDWEIPKYFGIADIEGCVNQIDKLANNNLKGVPLYAGARQVLDTIKGEEKLALLSSSPRIILEAALKYNGIYDYFNVILAGEDVKHHKPHPEVIEKGLSKLKGSKKNTVMIGDSRKDLEAAKNAGVDSILFYPKSHAIFYSLDNLKTYKPTHIVSSFKEMLTYLK